MNKMYGFDGEVKHKYEEQMADLFHEVFHWLPLAHLINGKVLVVHGGLTDDKTATLDDIRRIQRNREPPDEGLMCHLLWSDPVDTPGIQPSQRGVGVRFGPDVTADFLARHGLCACTRGRR